MPEGRLARTRANYLPAKMTDKELGISIRFIRQWDITPDPKPIRIVDWFLALPPEGDNDTD